MTDQGCFYDRLLAGLRKSPHIENPYSHADRIVRALAGGDRMVADVQESESFDVQQGALGIRIPSGRFLQLAPLSGAADFLEAEVSARCSSQ